MTKKIISEIMLILLSASIVAVMFNIQRVKAGGGFLDVRVLDSVTGEELISIEVKALWGSNFDKQTLRTTQFGFTGCDLGVNHTGDVLISTTDESRRYIPQNKLVHISFIQWVNTTAQVEIGLDRVTPLQSSYEGNYIVSFVKDRVVYYGERAYLVVGVKSPYDGSFGLGVSPDELSFVRVYGGYQYLQSTEITNITIQIGHSGYVQWDKTGNLTLHFGTDYGFLEEVNFTLTFKRNWGYDNYNPKVRVMDAETKENVSRISVKAWWGSSFNNYEYQTTSNGIATFNLGAFPDGDVQIKAYDNCAKYSSQFKEATMTGNPTTVTIEVERIGEGDQGDEPTTSMSYELWILTGFTTALVVTIASIIIIKQRSTLQKD